MYYPKKAGALSVAERSYPASEASGGWEETPESEVRGGLEKPPRARGQGQRSGEAMRGAVAAWAQEGLEELSHIEGQERRQ